MREEEAGMRYMSPLVKQDLAKLDKDGESRRIAMNSLKQFVEHLDQVSMPRFLAQVSESREAGGSRSYAILLYEEVARVHGKLIVPHITRVMVTLTRSLSASGSSPQLHLACAKVVTAVARFSIDSVTATEEAEEILRDLSQPLIDMIAGKLEPIAAGAAACMQALVESEKWKYASEDLVIEVCHRTTLALGEKSTRTVAHMQLARSLATLNPDSLSIYGLSLLRSGGEILQSAGTSWQHRKCAAKMLQAVLSIVDRDILALELNSTTQALDSFRHDRMPHVRTAVSEALQTAKMLASSDTTRNGGDEEGLTAITTAPRVGEEPKSRPRRRNHWSSDDSSLSPVSKRTSPVSQESHHWSFSPASTSTTDSSHSVQVPSPSLSGVGVGGRMKRAPLFPAKSRTQSHGSTNPTASPSSSIDDFESLAHGSDAKENVPSRSSGINGVVSHEDESGLPGVGVWLGKYARPRAPTPGTFIPFPPTLLDNSGADELAAVPEGQRDVGQEMESSCASSKNSKDELPRCVSSLDVLSMCNTGKSQVDLKVEDGNTCSVVSTAHIEMEGHLCDSNVKSHQGELANEVAAQQLRLGNSQSGSPGSLVQIEYVSSLANGSLASIRSPVNGIELEKAVRKEMNSKLSSVYSAEGMGDRLLERRGITSEFTPSSTSQIVVGENVPCAGSGGGSPKGRVKITNEITPISTSQIVVGENVPVPRGDSRGGSPQGRVNLLTHQYNLIAHLANNTQEAFGSQNLKPLITSKDFLPFTTPRRLIRSLQSNMSSPDSKGSVVDQEGKSIGVKELVGGPTGKDGDGVDMDLDTSSDAGWSVRDNPIASDESFRPEESSEDELEGKQKGVYQALGISRKVRLADGVSLPEGHTPPKFPGTACPVDSRADGVGSSEVDCRTSRGGNIGTYRTSPRALHSPGGNALNEPACSSSRAQKPLLDCQMQQTGGEVLASEADSRRFRPVSIVRKGGLPSVLLEEESKGARECFSCSRRSEASVTGGSADEEDRESQAGTSPESEGKWEAWWERGIGQYLVVRFVKRNWRQVCWYVEFLLGGSLCVVLTLPLAMAAAKALRAPREYALAPT